MQADEIDFDGLFAKLIGNLVWGVQRTHGTFLIMEFGDPRLKVREPTRAAQDVDATPNQLRMSHRRVYLLGQWSLWVQCENWRLLVAHWEVTNQSCDMEIVEESLRLLDGQKLTGVTRNQDLRSVSFRFDLGATFEVSPSESLREEDQWTLTDDNYVMAIFSRDGHLLLGKSCRPKAFPGGRPSRDALLRHHAKEKDFRRNANRSLRPALRDRSRRRCTRRLVLNRRTWLHRPAAGLDGTARLCDNMPENERLALPALATRGPR